MSNVPADKQRNEIRTDRFGMVPFWVMDAVFDGRMKSSSLVVYCALLQFANSSRSCWPSTETLMERAGVSHNTYRQAVKELQECRALVVTARVGGSNLFELPMVGGVPVSEGGVPEVGGGGLPESGEGGLPRTDPLTISIELQPVELEPKELHTPLPSGSGGELIHLNQHLPKLGTPSLLTDGFEEFWSLFPNRKAKGDARKAWAKAVLKEKPAVILAALTDQAPGLLDDHRRGLASTEGRSGCPHPTTWLNGERWEDDPKPRGGGDSWAAVADRYEAAAAGDMWGTVSDVSDPTYPVITITGNVLDDNQC